MKKCQRCENESVDNANFCANCGASFQASPASSTSMHPNNGDATVSAIQDSLVVEALRKGFAEKYDGYRDFVTFDLRFQNLGVKPIKAFRGTVVVSDLFERHIINLGFQVEKRLAAGGTVSDTFIWDYNQFMEEHNKLRYTEWEYLSIRCLVKAVIFEDGSKLVADPV